MNFTKKFFEYVVDIGGDGPRVAIKNTIDVASFPTTAGSRALGDVKPAKAHAEVVRKLLVSGCRIVGITVLHELAYGVTGINDWAGTPPNPLFPDLIPGGSSSGSAAAVAAGLVEFALGTDTGGSVRIPAACCGIYGLKPGFGTLSREGVMPPDSSLDCVGIFARSIDWIEHAMAILDSGFVPLTKTPDLKLGIVPVKSVDHIRLSIASAIERSGFESSEQPIRTLEKAFEAGLTIIGAENFRAFGHLVGRGLLGSDIEARLSVDGNITDKDISSAEECRRDLRAELAAIFTKVDLLVLPTLSVFPPRLEAARRTPRIVNLTSMVRPFNLSGHPAIAIPLEPVAGQPISLQLVGPMGSEPLLCAAARKFCHVRMETPA
ncbi:amidase [Oryzicola mucosus]|uniref:Indoleacetamide hydrolase n=1 Tax=Oryzicola mucosus TaxID=2767425 RepID=A0A8J6PVK5_9HYPH|nr:amidase [Oryzicola mucosus]MBD0416789.1 amidase [Oryzicola mucosus]